jgi:anti-anti-sigma factor
MTVPDSTTSTTTTVRHQCRIVTDHRGSVRLVRVSGRLDWATAGQFRDLMRDDCTEPEVVIDLAQTDTADAAGTGVLVAAAVRAAQRGQRLVIVSNDAMLLEVMGYLELDAALPIVSSQEEALLYFDRHPQDLTPARS